MSAPRIYCVFYLSADVERLEMHARRPGTPATAGWSLVTIVTVVSVSCERVSVLSEWVMCLEVALAPVAVLFIHHASIY